jgi:hypothetical protein
MLTYTTATLAAVSALVSGAVLEILPEGGPQRAASPSTAATQDRRVTAQFQTAPVAEVMRWLRTQGVNFAASQGELPDTRITLNIVDQPLRDALRAVAAALGGRWERTGQIYVFRKGPEARFEFDGPDVRVRSMESDEMQRMSERMRRIFEEGRSRPIEGLDAERFRAMGEEIRKQMEEMMKDLPSRDRLPAMPKFERGSGPGGTRIMLGQADIRKLVEGLTAEQWAKHERQGYLTFEDLTSEQRRHVTVPSGDTWSLSFSIDGKTLNLRSGRDQ